MPYLVKLEVFEGPGIAWEVLEGGLRKARPIAREVLAEVRRRMGID
ncbi:hypothetical protein [Candidatus Solincola tengchongensis]|nr:hypothetical protein [Candidatus Solincola tengchongensis]